MLSLVVLIMIHKSVFTSVNFQLDNYKLDLQFSSENCLSVFFLQHCFFRTKLWHFDDIFSPLRESYYNLLRDVIPPSPHSPMSGFHCNTNLSDSCSARVILSCRHRSDTCVPRWGGYDRGRVRPCSHGRAALVVFCFSFHSKKVLIARAFHFLEGFWGSTSLLLQGMTCQSWMLHVVKWNMRSTSRK